MRKLVWIALLFTFACGQPQTRLDEIHISNDVIQIKVTNPKAWREQRVPVTCTVSGPETFAPQKIEKTEVLTRNRTSTTWDITFNAPKTPGFYSIYCETKTSSIKGEFEVPSAANPLAPARQLPALNFSLNVRPRIYSTDTEFGKAEQEGDEFETSSLKYIGYEFAVPGAGTQGMYTLKGCVLERSSTGVVQIPNASTKITPNGQLSSVGSFGYPWTGQWLPGEYVLKCDARGFTVQPQTFRVTGRARGNGQATLIGREISIPDATVEKMQFMEFRDDPPPVGQRSYYTIFEGGPRFVGTETTFALKASPKPIAFKYRCHYFNDEGDVIGRASVDVQIPAGLTEYYTWVSWGNRDGEYWQSGTYYVECDADGTFLGGRYFTVER